MPLVFKVAQQALQLVEAGQVEGFEVDAVFRPRRVSWAWIWRIALSLAGESGIYASGANRAATSASPCWSR